MKQVLHKAISLESAFLVARKRALSSPAIFQTASLSSAQHSISKWDVVRQSSRGSDSNRRWQDAKYDEMLQVLRIIVDRKQKNACLNQEKRQSVGGGRILRGSTLERKQLTNGSTPRGFWQLDACVVQSAARAQEAEEEVERFVRNMARTAVIAEDAFSEVPLQPKDSGCAKIGQGFHHSSTTRNACFTRINEITNLQCAIVTTWLLGGAQTTRCNTHRGQPFRMDNDRQC